MKLCLSFFITLLLWINVLTAQNQNLEGDFQPPESPIEIKAQRVSNTITVDGRLE